jgi:nucleoside-diphosphate-sugar epimerase
MFDVLILGCGYLGRRAAVRWREQGRRVAALTRKNAAELAALGIEPIVGDVCDPDSLKGLPPARTVLHAIGLDRTSGRTMRDVYVQGLANLLTALPGTSRFIHVSSTSVYGQTDGGWVTESSSTEPHEESGKVVLEAERLLHETVPTAVILRLAGIYGPGRLIRKQALLKGEPLVGDCEKWINLIHVDDGVDAILAAEANAAPGSVFNIADGSPVTRREFYTEWAKVLGAPAAAFDHQPEPGANNRRISNQAARAKLNWLPRHPDHRSGLAEIRE